MGLGRIFKKVAPIALGFLTGGPVGAAVGAAQVLAAPKESIGEAPAAPIAPTGEDPAVTEAARKEREAQLRARGRASTILTGGEGDTSKAVTARRTLLGG